MEAYAAHTHTAANAAKSMTEAAAAEAAATIASHLDKAVCAFCNLAIDIARVSGCRKCRCTFRAHKEQAKSGRCTDCNVSFLHAGTYFLFSGPSTPLASHGQSRIDPLTGSNHFWVASDFRSICGQLFAQNQFIEASVSSLR